LLAFGNALIASSTSCRLSSGSRAASGAPGEVSAAVGEETASSRRG